MDNLRRKNRGTHSSFPKADGGFTLIELVVSLAIGVIVLGAMYSVFTIQNKTFIHQEQIAEMQQYGRAAMEMMTREIRMAGYGVPEADIPSWINWLDVTLDSNPKIVQGSGSAPDTIYVASCFDSPPASLAAAASSGATSLTLQSAAQAAEFNTTSKKVISINGMENAIVTGIAGSTLTIDTNPATAGNQGLAADYGMGTSIYLVKVITYTIDSSTLDRNENTGAGAQPFAENIQDVQITQSGNRINLSLTARTAQPDPAYTENGGYRTYLLQSVITPRNLGS